MGIKPTQPGFGKFTMTPQPGTVTEASITLPTQAGTIVASFHQNLTSFVLTLAPPANTLARVCLPRLGVVSNSLVVDGKAMAGHAMSDYVCVDNIGSATVPRIISRS